MFLLATKTIVVRLTEPEVGHYHENELLITLVMRLIGDQVILFSFNCWL
ncbi:hypothetical protein RINTHH_2700 [Richelia intracellularis HH01]|jgi:hypothetical protein|uniref:Uncharacterized protein n=1 Tax=Richelia intracellularis HH01 TaxID=1165094 RepID=M1X293_9NOST|nr:hypothetical protein [Richelia intracellularis]CCH66425.1 hypothetical protein RINTHH_2700 [Richelia intracellularis HH01]